MHTVVSTHFTPSSLGENEMKDYSLYVKVLWGMFLHVMEAGLRNADFLLVCWFVYLKLTEIHLPWPPGIKGEYHHP